MKKKKEMKETNEKYLQMKNNSRLKTGNTKEHRKRKKLKKLYIYV